VPELNNFLTMLSNEEQQQVSLIQQNFYLLRRRMMERMKCLSSDRSSKGGDFSRSGVGVLY